MTDHDAMLRSILEHPRDDTPRLVYADWLDDAGEADRAEFVRVQVELARTAEPPITVHTGKPCAFGLADPKCPRCKFGLDLMREQELLCESGVKWIGFDAPNWQTETNGAIGRVGAAGKPRLIFTRGFISSVTLDWASWLRHHAGLFWSPRQTVEVPSGICHCGEECESHYSGSGHSPVDMPDCIPRPFVPTAQPLDTVRLTTHPLENSGEPHRINGSGYFIAGACRFDRVKCCRCGNRRDWHDAITGNGSCLDCHGTPLNRWTCPEWPGLEFVMPEANELCVEDRRLANIVYPDGTMVANPMYGR